MQDKAQLSARRLQTWLLLGVLLFAMPASALPFLNKPGKRVDVVGNLPKDQPTIVFYHAPWSKTSARYFEDLSTLEKAQSQTAIVGVDIRSMDSAVAKQHSITEVPWFEIYNEKHELVKNGQAALQQILEMTKSNPAPPQPPRAPYWQL